MDRQTNYLDKFVKDNNIDFMEFTKSNYSLFPAIAEYYNTRALSEYLDNKADLHKADNLIILDNHRKVRE